MRPAWKARRAQKGISTAIESGELLLDINTSHVCPVGSHAYPCIKALMYVRHGDMIWTRRRPTKISESSSVPYSTCVKGCRQVVHGRGGKPMRIDADRRGKGPESCLAKLSTRCVVGGGLRLLQDNRRRFWHRDVGRPSETRVWAIWKVTESLHRRAKRRCRLPAVVIIVDFGLLQLQANPHKDKDNCRQRRWGRRSSHVQSLTLIGQIAQGIFPRSAAASMSATSAVASAIIYRRLACPLTSHRPTLKYVCGKFASDPGGSQLSHRTNNVKAHSPEIRIWPSRICSSSGPPHILLTRTELTICLV